LEAPESAYFFKTLGINVKQCEQYQRCKKRFVSTNLGKIQNVKNGYVSRILASECKSCRQDEGNKDFVPLQNVKGIVAIFNDSH
jgi:hypothetical protein